MLDISDEFGGGEAHAVRARSAVTMSQLIRFGVALHVRVGSW